MLASFAYFIILSTTGDISMKENKQKAILIGAGEMGTCIPEVSEKDFVIALDGGLLVCEKCGIVPDMIVGDFDSLPEEKKECLDQYPEEILYRLPREKDDTDTLAAIKLAIGRGFREFVIYGGLGGRLSHTIANIQCLMYLKERSINGVLVGKDTKAFLLRNETCILDEKESGYVSIFAYSPRAEGISLKNLKYELEDACLTDSFPLGISNEFVGKSAEITVKEGTLLLVFDK